MTDATKKRIRLLMHRWCSAEVAGELAYARDAGMSVLVRHDAASEKAWAELDVEFDKLQEVSGG